MPNNLVIVESPAKARTLEKFLGSEFTVKSSYGHIRDLAKKGLGIDIENGFDPHYEVPSEKKKVVDELAKAARKADSVWLASDEDREGEAIAWHLTQVLGLPVESTKRIAFHEITKSAVLDAIDHPRIVNMDLVNAQQARRILDRLVGFELSPLLWRKVKPSLSAGRVQSVAVRLLVEREREIINFTTENYFRVTGEFVLTGSEQPLAFRALLNRNFKGIDQARTFLDSCIGAAFTVESSENKPVSRNPAPPFTTSTLQQEAGRKLGMSVARTMSVAQKLYENGLITYMRTDSVNLSAQAISAARSEITDRYGERYCKTRKYTTRTKGAQEAHEAIRPSYFNRETVEGTADERRLYELIWKRAVASQMASAELEKTVIEIGMDSSQEKFTATGEVIVFDGFLKLYIESADEDAAAEETMTLPGLKTGDRLDALAITATERFTQHPPRYSEASLVKKLEELGIGRPSTYAPTISTVINRGYVIKQNREGQKRNYHLLTLKKGKITETVKSEVAGKERNRLSPTDIGMLVNDYLEQQFSEILDYNFTAGVEKEFDEIAEGGKKWIEMISEFYGPFHATVEKALEDPTHHPTHARDLGKDPVTGRVVKARIGRYGPVVEIEGTDDEKPRFASIKKGQLIESITLDQALELFKLPRTLGERDGEEVVVSVGRYGPYVRYKGKFTSLPSTDDPYTITLDRAMELIEEKAKNAAAAKIPLKEFPEEPGMVVLKGRYGPYISFDGKNYPVPRTVEPTELTLEQAREIIRKKNERAPRKKK